MMKQNYCREILLEEFALRKNKNSMYTMRSFARFLGIGATSLSDVLANKRKLSKKNILKICDKLSLSPLKKQLILLDLSKHKMEEQYIESILLEEDIFCIISEWYYLAILNLAKIKTNRSSSAWIAKRLSVDECQIEVALSRLVRLNLIEIKDDRLIRTAKPLRTSTDIPSHAIREYQKGLLKKMSTIIEDDRVALEMRDFSSITMAINPKKIKQAKEILLKTKRKIERILEDDSPESVYILSYQLFPLTSEENIC